MPTTMGRAYPEAQMTSVAIGDLTPYPVHARRCARHRARRAQGAELEMDGAGQPQDLHRVSARSPRPARRRAPAREVKQWGIHGTTTKAIAIGARGARGAAQAHRSDRRDPVESSRASCSSRARWSTSRAAPPKASCAASCAFDGLDDDRGARPSPSTSRTNGSSPGATTSPSHDARPDLRARQRDRARRSAARPSATASASP